jgi:mono/diheme cytochrome c family protein
MAAARPSSVGPGSLAAVAVTAVAAAITALGCNSPGDDPGPSVAVDPAAIYSQMCARCHGADGRGDPELKKTLPVRDFSDPDFQRRAMTEEITRTIMTGKNQMPAFGGLLSAPKIQAISGYVRRLGRAPARPAAVAVPAAGGVAAPLGLPGPGAGAADKPAASH